MLRRGKDTPAPSAGAADYSVSNNGAARTPSPEPAGDDFDLDAELALVSAESQHAPEAARARPEVNYAPPVVPRPALVPPVEPNPGGSRLRRPLRARRASEPERPVAAVASRPIYPTGLPATPGGHLLGALLVEQELITRAQLDHALATQADSGLRLGEVLIRAGALDERQLTRVLADQFGIGLADLSQQAPDPQVAGRLSEQVAREYKALPLRDVDGVVEVVVGDPQPGMESAIQQALGAPVQLFAVTPTAARQAIDRAYRALADVDRMVKAFESSDTPRLSSTTARDEAIGSDSPVAKVVTMLVTEALRDRASDIHLEPSDNQLRVRFRIDGALHDVLSLPMNMSGALVSRIKILANMNIVERRKAQDGQFATDVDGRGIDVRVSTMATVWGEKCVMRVLDKSRSLYKLGDLGMPDRHPRRVLQDGPLPLWHGALRWPDGQRQDDDPLRHYDRDRRANPQHRYHRGSGRIRIPVDQPDPDQRTGRYHLRGRPPRHPPSGPRHHPRRRDPRHRHRSHRHSSRAHRAFCPFLTARHRLRRSPPSLLGYGHRGLPGRLLSPRDCEPATRPSHLPSVRRALSADRRGDGLLRGNRRGRRRRSSAAPAAIFARTPATWTGSVSTSFCT